MMKKDNSFVSDFETRVRNALVSYHVLHSAGGASACCTGTDSPLAGVSAARALVGAAVSGGADSVSLLVSLVHILGTDSVRVITINHNMRPEAETAGDAAYVLSLCKSLGVQCSVVTLERGEVAGAAHENGWSDEEAARILRYRAFESFIKNNNIKYLCLAHNQNDNLETLLMRFLQGSGSEGGSGIAPVRDVYSSGDAEHNLCGHDSCDMPEYIRPLLSIPRCDIERYLTGQNISWRTDATNSDNRFLRNKMRNLLMPELDEIMPGWRSAVLSGSEKTRDDNDALESETEKVQWHSTGDELTMTLSDFFSLPRAVQRRMMYHSFSLLGIESRVPYSLVQSVMGLTGSESAGGENLARNANFCLSAGGVCVSADGGVISVKKVSDKATESGFFGILKEEKKCIRSIQSGDAVRAKDGSMRSVSGILSSWKVKSTDRNKIRVVQDLAREGQPISAVLGSGAGYQDWIVTKES